MTEILLWPFVSASIAAGVFIFIRGLEFVVEFFHAHDAMVYLLPLAGLCVFVFEKIHFFRNLGNSELILEEIKQPRDQISWKLAPWVCVMTWWSHLFGASAGREGTAIQMGASLAETMGQVYNKYFPNQHIHRPLLLRMGLAGGFAAAFGAPWAGMVFALEHPRHFHQRLYLEMPAIFLTSMSAHAIGQWLGLRLIDFPQPEISFTNLMSIAYFVAALGLAFFAIFYQSLTTSLKLRFTRLPRWASLMLGGTLLSLAAWLMHSTSWHSLGDQLFPRAFSGSVDAWEGPLKLLLTSITYSSGFRGGEVVPLMSAGALLGNSLAALGGLPVTTLALVGLVVLFSLRLQCPLAALMFLLERVNLNTACAGILPVLLSWTLARGLSFALQHLKKRSTV